MARQMTLTADPKANSTLKILTAAKQAGVAITLSNGGSRTPCGLPIPELDVGGRDIIRHTNAVLRRVAQTTSSSMLGRGFAEEGQVESWLEWTALEVEHQILCNGNVAATYERLEAHLKSRTFLVGQRITLADISLAISLKEGAEKAGLDALRGKHPSFVRWLRTCIHLLGLGADAPASSGKKEAQGKEQVKAKAASPKQKPASPKAAPAAGGDDAAKAVGDDLRILKEKLKADGVTGKKLNDHPEVKALVDKLTALKAGGGAAAAAPAAKSPTASPKAAPIAAPAAEAEAEGGEKSDKKKAKDEAKKAKEDAKKKAEQERLEAAEAKKRGPDVTFDDWDEKPFGNLFIQSQTKTGREWTTIKELQPALKDKHVWVRARVMNSRKQGAKLCFLTFRKDLATVQAVLFGNDIAGFGGNLPDESVVDVYAKVSCPEESIKSATQSDVELQVERIYCIGRAQNLPIQLADLSRPDEDYEKDPTLVRVSQDSRLNNRVLDLRTVANQGIFKIQSGVCSLFREHLRKHKFTEIHTPKMIASASEGGADIFRLDYFEGSAYLAQSPQLYKQMALMTDLDRVFEIGPVFRSEKSFTHRHLTEFTGLDLEMTFKDHYSEVLDMLDGLFFHIFEGLNARFKDEIEAVRKQHPFEPLKYKYPCLKLKYPDAIKLLREKGPAVIEEKIKATTDEYTRGLLRKHLESVRVHDDEEDLGTEDEKVLGKVILQIYGEEFYMIDKFPTAVRPFYTMGDPNDSRWTNSYDLFLRGEEITSGAQRIHDPKMIVEKAHGMGIDTKPLQPYIDAFKYGAYPHAGAGIGMERVVMLFLNLPNIRKTSMFPRDPKRLEP